MELHADEYRRLNGALEERLLFEKLLSEISSAYTDLPAELVDPTIEFGLQRLGMFLRADRCNLAQFSERETLAARLLHSWGSEGIPPLPVLLSGRKIVFPWTMLKLKNGEVVQFSHPDELPPEAEVDRESFKTIGTRSQVAVPISVGGTIVGALAIDTVRTEQTFTPAVVNRLRRAGEIFANAVTRKEKELEIQSALQEIKKLKDQLEADCTYLREEIELASDVYNIVGQSDSMRSVFMRIKQVAPLDVTALILGETGTGKELVARAIHAASHRKERPMVKVNCAALPANLIESELFGHEKGAFTSAQARQVGRFELADGGTIFLDEVGELPLESQAKLLRVLQENEFERLGSSKTIKVDVRVLAATNRDLQQEIRKGRFREDLWYRLNVFPITVPPLRERKEDIALLVNAFVNRSSRKLGKKITKIPAKVVTALQAYQWPGNVRELENVVERAVINSQGPSLQLLDKLEAPEVTEKENGARPTLEEMERAYIIKVLEETRGRIDGPKGAAVILGLNQSTLRSRMRKLDIQKNVSME